MSDGDSGVVNVVWKSRLGADEVAGERWPDGVTIDVDPDAVTTAGAAILVDGDPPAELLDAPSLRHVIVPYAGVRSGLRERMAARPGLALHNSHFNAPFVAQHAVALLLSLAGRLGRYDRALRQGDWSAPDGPESVHLAGRVAVLLGFGAIGRATVPMLRGLGMEVEAVRRHPDSDDEEVAQWGLSDLHAVLGRADVVLASLPSTPSTDGLLDEAAFAAVRPGALLVNVGRGSVIDEDAAWDALASGRIAGLGLDVWWRYPDGPEERPTTLPSRRPFHLHPDVVLSPHRANAVAGWKAASVRDVLRTIDAIVSGRDPERNRVDVEDGY
ncbi:MAG: NAD(P)-dependent oxidoreductase [Trueperaceae bacterium]|nr:NAD(P)-dependent oxidoreductase [Trueperaceae bacterium]